MAMDVDREENGLPASFNKDLVIRKGGGVARDLRNANGTGWEIQGRDFPALIAI